MQGLFDAIRQNCFYLLPGTDKATVLAFLAGHLGGTELIPEFLSREEECNTGIGDGLAIPHLRAPGDGEVTCVVGWSPQGLDYGSIDGEPVHLVAMYRVPDSCKNSYLSEIACLVRIVLKNNGLSSFAHLPDLESARNLLLSWAPPQTTTVENTHPVCHHPG
jgi:mannitol/fructose-specific phosphotransferase system IIA component (Ntr-type)